MTPIKRQTAYKFWIRDLVSANVVTNEEGFKFFDIKGKRVVRVNLIALVIGKYVSEASSYVALTLDDGSGQIRVKAWGEDVAMVLNMEVGDSVVVIGRLTVQNDEVFLRPEVTRYLGNTKWNEFRRLELEQDYGKAEHVPVQVKMDSEEEEPVEPSMLVRGKIFTIIENCEDSKGKDIEQLIKEAGVSVVEAEKVIEELIREGEAFCPRNGFIKILS
ncbi:MAG: OB-fold nucleic acid binding domain-containing protein [archaeon]